MPRGRKGEKRPADEVGAAVMIGKIVAAVAAHVQGGKEPNLFRLSGGLGLCRRRLGSGGRNSE